MHIRIDVERPPHLAADPNKKLRYCSVTFEGETAYFFVFDEMIEDKPQMEHQAQLALNRLNFNKQFNG